MSDYLQKLFGMDGKVAVVIGGTGVLGGELASGLAHAGARVVGPFSTAEAAIEASRRDAIDCALIDINLGSGPNFDAAEALRKLGVPMVFVTGYDASVIPEALLDVPRLEKPFAEADVVNAVASICAG